MELNVGSKIDDDADAVFRLFSDISVDEAGSNARKTCSRCRRPIDTCWCYSLPSNPLNVNTTVYILQHPYEETRNFQTAMIVKLGLQSDRCHILKGKRFNPRHHADLVAAIENPNTLLMWPGPSAVDLKSYVVDRNVEEPHTLIVLDGTWHQARGIYTQNAFLSRLKQVQLKDTGVSNYVIRTQPTNACLSTVESIALAISILENRPDVYQALIRPLHTICEHQLSHGAVVHHSKQYLIENGLYVKQVPKKSAKKKQIHPDHCDEQCHACISNSAEEPSSASMQSSDNQT